MSWNKAKRTARGTTLRWASVVAAVLLVTACGGGGDGDDGESINLQFASALPEGGANYGFEWWADEVESRTDGRVTFNRHYSASLFGVEETFAALGDGRLDVGWLGSAFFGAEMPLWSVVGVPFQTYHPVGQAASLYEMWQENDAFRGEWEAQGMRPLIFQPWSPGVMGTSKPVEDVQDLEGLRLRTVGLVAPAFERVGVEAVAIPTEEMYEAVQRGVVDGYAPWSFDRSLVDVGVTEVAPYTVDPGSGHYASIPIAISEQTWSQLPEDVQQVMTEVAEEFMYEESVAPYRRQQDEACDAILKGGGSVVRFDEQEVAEFQEKAGSASLDAWLANAEKQGIERSEAEAFRKDWLAAYKSIASENPYESGIGACARRSE